MAERYKLQIVPAARRQLERLPEPAIQRIRVAIRRLAIQPRPSGAKPLTGREQTWRLRVGDYRVIYEIQNDRLVILVIRVGHRREVYR